MEYAVEFIGAWVWVIFFLIIMASVFSLIVFVSYKKIDDVARFLIFRYLNIKHHRAQKKRITRKERQIRKARKAEEKKKAIERRKADQQRKIPWLFRLPKLRKIKRG